MYVYLNSLFIADILPWFSLGNLLSVVGSTNLHLRLATKLHLDSLLLCLYLYRSEECRTYIHHTAFNI